MRMSSAIITPIFCLNLALLSRGRLHMGYGCGCEIVAYNVLGRNTALRLVPAIEIGFEPQVLDAAAVAAHQLQGLDPDPDMPFDISGSHG
jgi:hypothetical protein